MYGIGNPKSRQTSKQTNKQPKGDSIMKMTSNLTRKTLLSMAFVGSSMSAQAAIIAAPAVTGFSSEFSAGFAATNSVEGTSAEYASAGNGTGTFLEFTFGGATTFDRIVVVNRASGDGSDHIANYTLTYDGGATQSITRTAVAGQGGFDVLGTTTATTVRLDVDTLGAAPGFANTGAMEVYFLNTPSGMSSITTASAINSSAPFGGFEMDKAVDGVVGFNGGEFASTAGVNTFLEMDLGSLQQVGGFDFFDRLPAVDRVTGFDLTFSSVPTFDNGDEITQNYTGSTQSAEFAGVNARYVRYDATGGGGNLGVSEIQFYAIPEPSSAALLGLGGLALVIRRRRK